MNINVRLCSQAMSAAVENAGNAHLRGWKAWRVSAPLRSNNTLFVFPRFVCS